MFHDWTSTEYLRHSWKRVRRNKGAAGGDGQTLAQFSEGLDARLIRLSGQLRNGGYHAGPLRRFTLKKPGGGVRGLAIPCVRDRVAQAACARNINAHVDTQMSDASFAYRTGRSVEHAAGLVLAYRLRGYRWVVDGDIEACFDMIPHDQMMGIVAHYVACRKTNVMIAQWLKGFSREGRGLAQGSPLSPLLANLYLTDIDRLIDGKTARFVRYADDFLILTRSREDAQRAYHKITAALADRGLRLNQEKTRIARIADGVDFLGVRFRGIAVDRD